MCVHAVYWGFTSGNRVFLRSWEHQEYNTVWYNTSISLLKFQFRCDDSPNGTKTHCRAFQTGREFENLQYEEGGEKTKDGEIEDNNILLQHEEGEEKTKDGGKMKINNILGNQAARALVFWFSVIADTALLPHDHPLATLQLNFSSATTIFPFKARVSDIQMAKSFTEQQEPATVPVPQTRCTSVVVVVFFFFFFAPKMRMRFVCAGFSAY